MQGYGCAGAEEGGEGGEWDAEEAEGCCEEQGGEFLPGGHGRFAEDFCPAAAQEIVEEVVTEAEAVEGRLGKAKVVVFKGDQGGPFDDKTAGGEQSAKGGNGEMVEMARDVEVKPFVTGEASFGAAKVWDSAQKESAWAQQARDLSDGALRIDHMLEDVPHDNGIEGAILKSEGADVTDGYRESQYVSGVRGGLGAEFGALHLPTAVPEFPEQESWAAADIENTAFASEHCFEGDRAPAVEGSLEAFDWRGEAPCAAAVVCGRVVFAHLSGPWLRLCKGDRAIVALFDDEGIAGDVIAGAEKTLPGLGVMRAGRRHLAWHYDCGVVI